MTSDPSDDLRTGKELAVVITTARGTVSVISSFSFPDEKLDPHRWNEVASDIGAHVGYAVQHGCNSISIDRLSERPRFDKPNTSPGEAAFEEWAKEQIGEAGGRDDDDYWDKLTKGEQEMWDRIALAARRPLAPYYTPKLSPEFRDE
jgi:hypothetical protein